MAQSFNLSLILTVIVLSQLALSQLALATEPLRILTWEGYVKKEDIQAVDNILSSKGLPYHVEVIKPFSEGAEQMFDLIRGQYCDVSFLTLFFIKIEKEQTARLLQPINQQSPYLTNYSNLLPSLTQLEMGMDKFQNPLYIPWGGGVYGFYIDYNTVEIQDVPKSVKELWQKKWRGRFSLNKTQSGYNLGLALMSLGKSPFHLYHLIQAGKREEIKTLVHPEGELQLRLNQLYQNAGNLWTSATEFESKLAIVSSWGPEIQAKNKAGGDWQMIQFEEGQMVWLDTINFVKHLKGEKLIAAEIFANYFIGKSVQNRIAKELSMMPAIATESSNSALGQLQELYQEDMFVPPYDEVSYGIIKKMSNMAEQSIQQVK